MIYEISMTNRALEPVSLNEFKDWISMSREESHEDDRLNLILKSAANTIEKHCGISLGERTLTGFWRAIKNKAYFELPYYPYISLTSIHRVYQDGTTDELTENTDFWMEGLYEKRINMYAIWSTAAGKIQTGIKVVWKAGYKSSGVILPDDLRMAVIIQAAHDYEFPVASEAAAAGETLLTHQVLAKIAPYVKRRIIV